MGNQERKRNQVGIIGGGQLALMLGNALIRLGIKPIILADSVNCPAARVFSDAILGSASDERALSCLFSQVGHVIFENEFVDCELLSRVALEWKPTLAPKLEVLRIFQDKIEQKKVLSQVGIPSAEFKIIRPEQGLEQELQGVLNAYGGSCVLKWARMGYDGKGVLAVHASQFDINQVNLFFDQAKKRGTPVFAERKIDFRRELAVVGVRSSLGEFGAYPLVISEQRNGICYRVFGPATSLRVSSELEKKAHEYARKLSQVTGLIGAFAIEFFETQDGEILVNEVAPRVHNSGHFTQDACLTDQFENHCRAVLGLPLGDLKSVSAFAMLNLLGPSFEVSPLEESLPIPTQRLHLHWYGKREIRALRKLGHLNGLVETAEEMPALLSELEECQQRWLAQLQKQKKNTERRPA